jgi:RNA polymerase sigma-70 factor (ECF subfamily)
MRESRVSGHISPPSGTSTPMTTNDKPTQDFIELYERHERSLGAFLIQIVGDRASAEDLLQDTFLVAWREHRSGIEIRSERAWLFGIARNRALAHLRRWRRASRTLSSLRVSAKDPSAGPAEMIEARDLLARELSPGDRALVLLHYLHGFEGRELAELSGLTHAATRKRLSRARRRLAHAWREDEPTTTSITICKPKEEYR